MADETSGVRRLYRRRDGRLLGGVAGGLAEHLRVDVMAVRAVFVVLVLAGGMGAALYAAFWAVVPEEPAPGEPPPAGWSEPPDSGEPCFAPRLRTSRTDGHGL